jgi:secreted Zn-dependent insulinase-like peptidase
MALINLSLPSEKESSDLLRKRIESFADTETSTCWISREIWEKDKEAVIALMSKDNKSFKVAVYGSKNEIEIQFT